MLSVHLSLFADRRRIRSSDEAGLSGELSFGGAETKSVTRSDQGRGDQIIMFPQRSAGTGQEIIAGIAAAVFEVAFREQVRHVQADQVAGEASFERQLRLGMRVLLVRGFPKAVVLLTESAFPGDDVYAVAFGHRVEHDRIDDITAWGQPYERLGGRSYDLGSLRREPRR